jgi:hypothetical protein
MGLGSWFARFARFEYRGFGDPNARSADLHALIEIDLDHKKTPEQADGDEPGRSAEPDDSSQAR